MFHIRIPNTGLITHTVDCILYTNIRNMWPALTTNYITNSPCTQTFEYFNIKHVTILNIRCFKRSQPGTCNQHSMDSNSLFDWSSITRPMTSGQWMMPWRWVVHAWRATHLVKFRELPLLTFNPWSNENASHRKFLLVPRLTANLRWPAVACD